MLEVPVVVGYGDQDIFGPGASIVRERFPAARQITFTAPVTCPGMKLEVVAFPGPMSMYSPRVVRAGVHRFFAAGG